MTTDDIKDKPHIVVIEYINKKSIECAIFDKIEPGNSAHLWAMKEADNPNVKKLTIAIIVRRIERA